MVKEQSNMNHVTKITWHKKSSRQDKINKLLLIIQKFLSVHRHPLRQHILKMYDLLADLTTLKNLCWDGMTLGEQLRWISVYVQWTLGHRFSIRNPIILNIKIRKNAFSGRDRRTWDWKWTVPNSAGVDLNSENKKAYIKFFYHSIWITQICPHLRTAFLIKMTVQFGANYFSYLMDASWDPDKR